MIGARWRINLVGCALVPAKRSKRGEQQAEFADAPLIGKDFNETLPRPTRARKTAVERGVTRRQSRRRGRSCATARFPRTPEARGILLQQLFDGNAHGRWWIAGRQKC
jgi:hypothetical protein